MDNQSIRSYSPAALLKASVEIFLHFGFLLLGYSLLSTRRWMRRPLRLRVLNFIGNTGKTIDPQTLLLIFIGIVFFEWLRTRTSVISEIIPGSLNNVFSTLTTVVVSSVVLLLSQQLAKLNKPILQVIFWSLWIFFIAVQASGLILAGTIGFVVATILGLFLGSKRPPWVFMVVIVLLLSILNQGKFEIRQKYWNIASPSLVALYSEWFETSYDLLTGNKASVYRSGVSESGQSLFGDRLSNLQMLLYVQKKVTEDEIPVLMGETYLYGPMLLIPRFFWPEKPIAHQSQIKLNKHFKRQAYRYAHEKKTFIAWGILPEAYGNFGPFSGAIISGLFMGMLFKLLAGFALHYPLNSVRALLALVLLAMSFSWPTMESSVILTSTLQVIALVLAAGFVLGRRKLNSSFRNSGTLAQNKHMDATPVSQRL